MTDMKEMPADGGGVAKGKPDGVSGPPEGGEPGRSHGRTAGGESGGGAYPNPRSDGNPHSLTFSGGQSEQAYYGGDNPNATARPRDGGEGDRPDSGASAEARPVQVGGQTIEVIEQSGVATAEATGKVATDAPYEEEQESPGAG